MMETFSDKQRSQVLSHIGMVRSFCGVPMLGCYQDHGILSPKHNLIAQSHSRIHGA